MVLCVLFLDCFFLRWTKIWKGDVAFLCLFFRVFLEKVELWKRSKSKQGSRVWISGTRIFMYNWNSKQPQMVISTHFTLVMIWSHSSHLKLVVSGSRHISTIDLL